MNSIAIEFALLGAIMQHNDILLECGHLNPDDFENASNQVLYTALKEMYGKDIPADPLTILNHIGEEKFKSIGGSKYLNTVIQSCEGISGHKQYIKIIKEKSDKKNLVRQCQNAIEQINNDMSYSDVVSELESGLIQTSFSFKPTYYDAQTAIDESLAIISERKESGGGINGVPCGYLKIDNAISGLQAGQLNVIAGRPSMGKTAFALNIMARIPSDKKVMLFSMEMDLLSVMSRLYGLGSRTNTKHISGGKLNDREESALYEQAGRMSDKNNFFIDTSGEPTVNQIRSSAKKVKIKHGLDVIIVDHIGLIRPANNRATRNDQIGEISKALKAMAKELDCSVIALSQLSRAVESRQNKQPVMSDLRESGNIEQDADTVMLLYRDDYYTNELKDDSSPSDLLIIIAKNRNGESGQVRMNYYLRTQLIEQA